MVSFLESQIGLLELHSDHPDIEEVEDLIAFHLTALERLESHLGAGGLCEQDRELVPLFQRWLQAARQVKTLVQGLREKGQTAKGYDDLLRALNRAKPVAEDFDHFVELNRCLASAKPASNGG